MIRVIFVIINERFNKFLVITIESDDCLTNIDIKKIITEKINVIYFRNPIFYFKKIYYFFQMVFLKSLNMTENTRIFIQKNVLFFYNCIFEI